MYYVLAMIFSAYVIAYGWLVSPWMSLFGVICWVAAFIGTIIDPWGDLWKSGHK